MPRSRLAGLLFLVCVLGLPLGLSGCGNSNPNEREFLATAPPGKPPDDPEDQKVAHRRERTRAHSKEIDKIEKRGQSPGGK
jgi:hypothetical protein